MDTAAIIHHLDYVVTSDTSMAHLAGALGMPTCVMLGFTPDWRWLQDRIDSPWYPTLSLFRQQKIGDWLSVTHEIKKYLEQV
jgi:ADP-heptose:LPS heptosyltransferase